MNNQIANLTIADWNSGLLNCPFICRFIALNQSLFQFAQLLAGREDR
jgi:hypothetical protein